MELTYLKIIYLVAMAVVSFAFGASPIKIRSFIENKRGNDSSSQYHLLIFSLLSCFSGGVFLGVCLLDLLPFSYEAFEDVKNSTNFESDYPFVSLVTGAGFFLVYFIEAIVLDFCVDQNHKAHTNVFQEGSISSNHPTDNVDRKISSDGDNDSKSTNCNYKRDCRINSVMSLAKIDPNASKIDENKRLMKSALLIVAFTFHSCIEGFAFGVQQTTISASTLFLGIIIHKGVVAFSIGMNLTKSHPNRTIIILLLLLFFSLTSPVGGAVGILVETSSINLLAKNIVAIIMTCLATGTIIYITFFEILFDEQQSNTKRIFQCLATILGFAIISGLMAFDID